MSWAAARAWFETTGKLLASSRDLTCTLSTREKFFISAEPRGALTRVLA
jgi:hypothetical protein